MDPGGKNTPPTLVPCPTGYKPGGLDLTVEKRYDISPLQAFWYRAYLVITFLYTVCSDCYAAAKRYIVRTA